MKTISLLFAILFAAGLSSQAQGTWTQKADFGGSARERAVGFSIGSKGYIGTGNDGSFKKDFWEYDPALDIWTQKADFAGGTRADAVGFSIGNKGYVGTGRDYADYPYDKRDFWEYDPAMNTWTQKADYGAGDRYNCVGFSIGTKGYVGMGDDYGFGTKDFWEYDTVADTWTKKANFKGAAREDAVGISIGNKGYVGMGFDYFSQLFKDFWEYDPASETWTEKARFEGNARAGVVGFNVGNKGYIGNGFNYGGDNSFYEYDPALNTWTRMADFGTTYRYDAVGFSIGDKGYVGTGYDEDEGVIKKYFWEYTPGTSSCAVPGNLSVKNITSSSAKLKWNAVADAQRYKLRYKITGSSTWTTITNISSASKTISGLASNTSYTCEVKSVCSSSPMVSSDWSSKQEFTTGSLRMGDEAPQQISFQIYPNPSVDHATIQFTLPQSSHVYIRVYDVSGKEITTLLNDDVQQGAHSLQLSTKQFLKGVYMVKMISGAGIENQKLIVQ